MSCKEINDYSLIAFNEGEKVFKDYAEKFKTANRFDFVNGFVTGSEYSYELFIEFTKYVIDLKDSDIDSIDYHYYLNSTIEEMFINFLYLKQCKDNQ
jgi:hypothetical protein